MYRLLDLNIRFRYDRLNMDLIKKNYPQCFFYKIILNLKKYKFIFNLMVIRNIIFDCV